MNQPPALLVLEDGTVFTGAAFGAWGKVMGELAVNTAMTGYQEILTSAAYKGSILAMTSPHVGNTGVNDADADSQILAAGLVLREIPRVVSSWRAQRSLTDDLTSQGIVGIGEIDTRALVRRLRGLARPVRAGIFSGDTIPKIPGAVGEAMLVDQLLTFELPSGEELVGAVTTKEGYVVGSESAPSVAVVDLGMGRQYAKWFANRGISARVLPASTTASEIAHLAPNGVCITGGPGDPADLVDVLNTVAEILDAGHPVLGVGLGHQLIARSLGMTTVRLATPHGGTNYPVKSLATGKVDMTNHAHSYGVEVSGNEIQTTHICLNDGAVEGFRVKNRPIFGFQFHPNLGFGPTDARRVFDPFISLVKDA